MTKDAAKRSHMVAHLECFKFISIRMRLKEQICVHMHMFAIRHFMFFLWVLLFVLLLVNETQCLFEYLGTLSLEVAAMIDNKNVLLLLLLLVKLANRNKQIGIYFVHYSWLEISCITEAMEWISGVLRQSFLKAGWVIILLFSSQNATSLSNYFIHCS